MENLGGTKCGVGSWVPPYPEKLGKFLTSFYN